MPEFEILRLDLKEKQSERGYRSWKLEVRALRVRAVVASWSCSYLLVIPRRYAGVDVPLQLLMLLVSSPDKYASGGAAISIVCCCCFSRSFRRLLMLLSFSFTDGLSRPVVVVGRLRRCQGGEKKGDEGRGRPLGDGGEMGEEGR